MSKDGREVSPNLTLGHIISSDLNRYRKSVFLCCGCGRCGGYGALSASSLSYRLVGLVFGPVSVQQSRQMVANSQRTVE